MKLFQVAVLSTIFFMMIGCCAPLKNMVLVKGGTYEEVEIKKFYIGIYEVTQKQWVKVMGTNPSYFKGDDLPVEKISWYDAVIFCNKLSELEGLEECYTIDELVTDSTDFRRDLQVKYQVKFNPGKNGYRLPTEKEWEYASIGGRKSRGFNYSGSDDIDEVGWYKRNSGDKILKSNSETFYFDSDSLMIYNNSTKPVGSKKPNELGIYDMTGNVLEYCSDFKDYHYEDFQYELGDPSYGQDVHVHLRTASGGSWMYDTTGNTKGDAMIIAPFWRDSSCGLRIVRRAGCF
ncbi:MAG: SUMF1/EgtB/PvdO family nonheme iron enzyme [Candidatus Delongbacteria bacterium]|nr:SUMF1/EgtB/PvdO family nonheme iron enzyme [Candidatus Delongbacteria bacterium]